jgi:hypothetical protein
VFKEARLIRGALKDLPGAILLLSATPSPTISRSSAAAGGQPEEDETDRAAEKRRDMGCYAAALVHMHVAENLAGDRTPSTEICWSLDVQNRELHSSPGTHLQRKQYLEDACRFIHAMWDRV